MPKAGYLTFCPFYYYSCRLCDRVLVPVMFLSPNLQPIIFSRFLRTMCSIQILASPPLGCGG